MIKLQNPLPQPVTSARSFDWIRSACFDRPLVLIACAFAAGILAARAMPILAAVLICCVAAFLAFINVRFRPVILSICAFALLGAIRHSVFASPGKSDISTIARQGYVTLTGQICSDIVPRGDSDSFEIAVAGVQRGDGQRITVTGLVAATFRPGVDQRPLDFGDWVVARGKLEPPEPASNEGGFDYAGYLANRGVYSVFKVRRGADWSLLQADSSPADWIGRASSHLRNSLLHSFIALHRTEAGLLSGVMIGARSELPSSLNDDFVATGTVHILATAGLHVGVFLGVIVLACRFLRFARRPSAIIQLASLVLYTLMAGARPSVVRAALVAGIYIAGRLLEREPDMPSAISAAALILLMISPGYLFDMGFQLSFATVVTIVVLMPAFEPFLKRIKEIPPTRTGFLGRALAGVLYMLAGVICVSFSAQLGAAPITAQYFNQVSLIGVVANAVVVPLLLPIMGLGLLAWLLSLLSSAISGVISMFFISPLLAILIGAARTFAAIPGAQFNVVSPGSLWITAYYVALFFAAIKLRGTFGRRDSDESR